MSHNGFDVELRWKKLRAPNVHPARFGIALIAVLWAYDGFADPGFAAGEVKTPSLFLVCRPDRAFAARGCRYHGRSVRLSRRHIVALITLAGVLLYDVVVRRELPSILVSAGTEEEFALRRNRTLHFSARLNSFIARNSE